MNHITFLCHCKVYIDFCSEILKTTVSGAVIKSKKSSSLYTTLPALRRSLLQVDGPISEPLRLRPTYSSFLQTIVAPVASHWHSCVQLDRLEM